ncbi:Starch-binding associating with outer membrane [Pseudarcicella hirudinis]|uniref:Starch-binding associating with outer membrane n=1 Tax=Pseudarcicella hirudinis TaxID=1079859 RepID=A0A1I5M1B7_9BACT|nr:RagB/SusD family nutrient uptake outer membrane protein [Pseudarcicella hirudinis]SFP03213.1 Starch-binding associating with outer membrane [Pseudarcicella hirudinis]
MKKTIIQGLKRNVSLVKPLGLCFALALSTSSCKEALLDTTPYGSISSSNMWTSDNLTDLGVTGVYQALRLGITNSGASGRELYHYDRLGFTGMTTGGDEMVNGTVATTSGLFSNTWKEMYEGVQRANDAIVNISKVSPSSPEKKARYIAECKFLRAYYYLRLNQVFKGVPVYLEPTSIDKMTKGRETETKVWDVIIQDLTDAINEPNLPAKYAKGAAQYGHATKGAAYALRGKAYIYQKKWKEAAADFAKVKEAGYTLFADYKALFKEANEQSDEMIFSMQNIGIDGYGSTTQWYCGSRSSFGSCWNTYTVSPNLVDLYENSNGSKFSWDDIIPGYSAMDPAKREVFFLRNNLTATEITTFKNKGLDMSLYLPDGNEERVKKAYDNRDPRLAYNVITPYSTYRGRPINGSDQTFTSRWPNRNENPPVLDLTTDTKGQFYYLYRKFVYEGSNEIINRQYGPIDFPIIRYADVLLMWAEALNEQGSTAEAVSLVNQVRARAGVALLNSSAVTTVSSQADLRERIRNERRMEFPNEGINYFDELRWGSWKTKVFSPGNGVKQIWGSIVVPYNLKGDYIDTWPIPPTETQMNPNLVQNSGWIN